MVRKTVGKLDAIPSFLSLKETSPQQPETPKPTNKQKLNEESKNKLMAVLCWQRRGISASPKYNGNPRLYPLDCQLFSKAV